MRHWTARRQRSSRPRACRVFRHAHNGLSPERLCPCDPPRYCPPERRKSGGFHAEDDGRGAGGGFDTCRAGDGGRRAGGNQDRHALCVIRPLRLDFDAGFQRAQALGRPEKCRGRRLCEGVRQEDSDQACRLRRSEQHRDRIDAVQSACHAGQGRSPGCRFRFGADRAGGGDRARPQDVPVRPDRNRRQLLFQGQSLYRADGRPGLDHLAEAGRRLPHP